MLHFRLLYWVLNASFRKAAVQQLEAAGTRTHRGPPAQAWTAYGRRFKGTGITRTHRDATTDAFGGEYIDASSSQVSPFFPVVLHRGSKNAATPAIDRFAFSAWRNHARRSCRTHASATLAHSAKRALSGTHRIGKNNQIVQCPWIGTVQTPTSAPRLFVSHASLTR